MGRRATARLVRRSVCPCGASTVRDEVPLNIPYELLLDSIRGGWHYQCGTCGQRQNNVTVVLADRDSRNRWGWMPLELFSWEERKDA
jgi:hypothetical protein